MKRILWLLVIIALVIFSATIFADDSQTYVNHANDEGIVISATIDPSNSTLPYVNRSNFFTDADNPDLHQQSAEVTLDAEAYIPCYLKLVLSGNTGKTSVESFGPDADAVQNETKYYIVFDNEVGGFVDENWNVVGHGKNAEIAPGTGNYIRACDVFKVQLYSNDNYKYQVVSAPLTTNNADVTAVDKTLDLQMRTQVDQGSWSAAWSFSKDNVDPIAQKHSCESTTILHDFRVPYLMTTAHGQYSGSVTFRAYTI